MGFRTNEYFLKSSIPKREVLKKGGFKPLKAPPSSVLLLTVLLVVFFIVHLCYYSSSTILLVEEDLPLLQLGKLLRERKRSAALHTGRLLALPSPVSKGSFVDPP